MCDVIQQKDLAWSVPNVFQPLSGMCETCFVFAPAKDVLYLAAGVPGR